MTTVYKWRIYCTTDNKWEYLWAKTSPTTCPINTSHIVNLDSINEIDELSDNSIVLKEEDVPTGGHYHASGTLFNIPNSVGEHEHSISHPIPINALAVSFTTNSSHEGDTIEFHVAPDTTVGVLTTDVSSGNVLEVSSTVIQNIKKGFWCTISDGVNTENLGRVISVGNTNITVENSVINSYSAATPTYINMTIKMVSNYHLCNSRNHVLGTAKLGATYVPVGTVIKVVYNNNNGLAKKLVINYEYLY